MSFQLVAHCDWSIEARKRWIVLAQIQSGVWRVQPPRLVGDCLSLIPKLQGSLPDEGSVFIGFDFPIGFPEAYAKRAGFSSFRQALSVLGHGEWSEWFDVAQRRDEISILRPFYPKRPGRTRKSHQIDALGVADANALLRRCELATPQRQAACSLFWTLGGNQVGKGALSGWAEIIIPKLSEVALWPFDGALSELSTNSNVVLAETYPGDVYRQLGLPRRGWSKRRQTDRRDAGGVIANWLASRPHIDASALSDSLMDGFGDDRTGEDRFDAFVGLLGMLTVVSGERLEAVGMDGSCRLHEGWILGHHR